MLLAIRILCLKAHLVRSFAWNFDAFEKRIQNESVDELQCRQLLSGRTRRLIQSSDLIDL